MNLADYVISLFYNLHITIPDVTARILHGLVEAGMGPEDKTVQKCLSFLLRTQCRNGAWWSRWWAGYISGTDFVLDVFSRMGGDYPRRFSSSILGKGKE